MRTSGLRAARDYNRGLILPVRAAHTGLAALRPLASSAAAWCGHPARRAWAPYLLIALAGFFLLLPFDGPISRALRSIKPGGDFRRELEAFQQWGQGVSTLLIMLAVWLQDPARRARLLDWGAGLLATGLAVTLIKLLVGRPRPKYDDPFYFLGPFGQYPVIRGDRPVGIHHAWDLGAPISAELWSMPSSHTAYAAVMAAALSTLYPRLRPLAIGCAVGVGLSRVVTGAHYPTDVVIGACVGAALGSAAMQRLWGRRALAAVGPALAKALRRERIPGPIEARREADRARALAEAGRAPPAGAAPPSPPGV